MSAGAEISLRIGQSVRLVNYDPQRITGIVRGLSADSDQALMVDVVLDAPIVIPPYSDGERAIEIWNQHVPAHEVAPFDARDGLIAEMLAALQAEQEWRDRDAAGAIDPEWDYEIMVGDKRRSAIARAAGQEGVGA